MNEPFYLLLGAIIGFVFTLTHERIGRLHGFRGRITAYSIRLSETTDASLAGFYAASRLEIMEQCAVIQPDISRLWRKRFDTAVATYHTAQQSDQERERNELVHVLCPEAVPLMPDQRSLRERIVWAIQEMMDCAKHTLV